MESVRINGKPVDLSRVAQTGIFHDMALIREVDSGLLLHVQQPDPFLIFPATLVQAQAERFYDWLPLGSVFVLSFIFWYALIFKYLAGYWQVRGMRNDLSFLIALALLLVLPISRLNTSSTDSSEKRALAVFPSYRVQGELNVDFGKQFEAWLNDRFAGRNFFIAIHDQVDRVLNSGRYENSKAFEGRSHWLFYKGENSIELFKNQRLFTLAQKEQIRQNLEQQQRWLEQRGIASYVFVAPNKEDVYGEYYKPGVYKVCPEDRIVQLKRYLEAQGSRVDIQYPLSFLKAHKSDGWLYWRTDTHWNDYGAYLGYQSIMDRIAAQFPNVKRLPPASVSFERSPRPRGDLSVMLSIQNVESFDTESYLVPVLSGGFHYSVVSQKIKDNMPFEIRTVNPGKKYKVIVFRDSFATGMLPYLSETFGEVLYIWDYNMDLYGDLILKEHPDIVLREMVSRSAVWLLQGTSSWKGEK